MYLNCPVVMFDAGRTNGRDIVRSLENRRGRSEDVKVEEALNSVVVDRIRCYQDCDS